MSAKSVPFLNKSHNFGIFLKKGKRGILQLDFPSQMLLMIQRGHIKKSQPFNSILYFESEEDLHISMRFLDGELDFEADTVEEKYTICRLLDLILEAENEEPIKMLAAAAASGGVCVLPRVPLVPHNVLKDGVLEKKGNTTITTWNRRRVKISAGEFAYFKPGEELALNVVHLRQDRCVVQRVGQNSLHLSVNQRQYCFRVPNDSRSGLSVETVRDDWIKAFEQAMTMKRAVSVLYSASFLSPEEEDPGHQGDTEAASDVSSADGSPFVGRKMQPEAFNPSGLEALGNQSGDSGKPEITASVSVHFSYKNNNTNTNNTSNHSLPSSNDTPTATATAFVTPQPQPPKPAKRAKVYPFRREVDRDTDSRHDSGREVVSRPHPDSLSDDLPVTALRAKFTAHGIGDTDPTLIKSTDVGYSRSASLKEARAQKLNDRILAFSDLNLGENDPKFLVKRPLPEPTTTVQHTVDPPGEVQLQSKKYAKERPSVMGLWRGKEPEKQVCADGEKNPSAMQRWKEMEQGKNSFGVDNTSLVDFNGATSFRDDTTLQNQVQPEGFIKEGTEGNLGVQVGRGSTKKGLWKASSMSDLLDLKVDEDKDVMDPKAEMSSAPVPKPTPAPPPPPPCFVPPPPAPPIPAARNLFGKGGVKLKQVHWTPVDKKMIPVSLWGEKASNLPSFDMALLEAMFSVCEREATCSKRNKAVKQTLVDPKRAQNLGILFSGFKADSVAQLTDALSSVTELDTFQIQKMTTLKRFQPTAEDTEMFRMYRQSRDSLTPVDRFMLDLCQIPRLSMRIDLVLSLWDFPNNYRALAEEVEELLSACELLLSSPSLPSVLQCLLSLGNHLNAKRQPKNVHGFQISSIDKMVDLKGREPDYSLMTYLVEQLHASRPDLLDWTVAMDPVPKVAGYSVRAIGAEIDVLKNDLQKVKKYQKTLKGVSGVNKKFQSDVQNFVLEYEKRMQTIHEKNDRLKHRFHQLLAWLGEPPSRTSDVLFSSLALLIDRFNIARARLAT